MCLYNILSAIYHYLQVPYARSQLYLSEVMDRVCSSFKDYTLANYKSSGTPTLLRVVTHDGNMNPEMSNVDIVPSPESNGKLAFYVSYGKGMRRDKYDRC